MFRSTKSLIVCAALAFFVMFGGDASAQRKTSDSQSSLAVREALSTVMLTDQFRYAERNNDLTTMRELLAPYGLGVAGNEPQLIPNCQPPYGYPVWTWIFYNGQWMYGWACLRGGAEPIEPPITYVD